MYISGHFMKYYLVFFLGKCGVWFEQRWRSLKSLSLWSGWFSCWNPNSEQQIIGPCWIKKVSLFMNKYTYILAKKFTISACTTQYAYKIAHRVGISQGTVSWVSFWDLIKKYQHKNAKAKYIGLDSGMAMFEIRSLFWS